VRIVIASDLHLGAASGADLLRSRPLRDRLLEVLEGADRIVLLGDVVELRDRPLADALEAARPVFEDLAAANPGAELVVVPGNHDHQLLDPWLARRRLADGSEPLGLEQRIEPTEGAAAKLAGWAGRERTTFAYPGLRPRDDVYATHGHYLDCHLTLPTFERLGVGTIERLAGSPPNGARVPDDYERVQAPLYALLFVLAQSPRSAEGTIGGKTPSMRVWEALGGASGKARSLRGRLLGSAVIPGAVRVANRLGLGRFGSDLSLAEVGRAGVRAMAEAVERLGIDAEHVIFGHTHRRGPLPGEDHHGGDPRWSGGGARLYNTGGWVYAPAVIAAEGPRSPFWPGTVIELVDDEPPRARELLSDLDERQLRDALRRA
jgi:predicted phosphodiesterase